MTDTSRIAEQLWSIAAVLRGSLRIDEFADVILSFILLRRFDLFDFQDAQKFQRPDDLLAQIADAPQEFRDTLRGLDFPERVSRLATDKVLPEVVRAFAAVDLSPGRFAAKDMALVVDELLERFCRRDEFFGEYSTATDVAGLMTALLLADNDVTGDVHIYDPACGTGGLLLMAQQQLVARASEIGVTLHGQDINAPVAAICKTRLLASGASTAEISIGNSLATDFKPQLKANYLISHPPFNIDWTSSQPEVTAEHATQGYEGRFGPGLPQRGDGSLLFLLDMISKMKPAAAGGSRLVFVSSGSPLWSGGAGSGESEIRRYLLEKDLLEAVVALPPNIWSHTGIVTYVWVLSNKKPASHAAQVRVVDATESFVREGRSGRKRYRIEAEEIKRLVRLGTEASPDSPRVRTFENQAFGCQRLTIESPLRLRVDITPSNIDKLHASSAWKRLAKTPEGLATQGAITTAFGELAGKVYMDRAEWRKDFATALGGRTLKKSVLKVIESTLGCSAADATLCMDGDKPEADPKLRRTEELPLDADAEYPLAKPRSAILAKALEALR